MRCQRCHRTIHQHCLLSAVVPISKSTPEAAGEALSPRDIEEDKNSDIAMTATFDLLADFRKRHNTLISPLKMYTTYASQTKKFQELCDGFDDISDSLSVTAPLRHALRYATAAYGPAYLHGYMFSGVSTAFAICKKSLSQEKQTISDVAVASILACPVENILTSRWTYKVFEPCYCVIVDPGLQWVVLAIRGTLGHSDMLTDVTGHVHPCDGGLVHEGVGKAVDTLMNDEKLITTLREGSPMSFSLIVTGHSLGAAVASVFALRALRENTFGERKVFGYAFAPPPTVSDELSCHPLAQEHIVSVVAGVDCIPRLSFNSIERLGAVLNDFKSVVNIQPETYIIGRVLLITDPLGKSTKLIEVPRCSTLLMNLTLAPRMFNDHMIETYAKGLDLVVKQHS